MTIKKILTTLLAVSILAICATATGFAKVKTYQDSFTDVVAENWFYNDVKSTYELGLMNGNSNEIFLPDGDITIAEALTVASRAASIAKGDTIPAAEGPWYAMYYNYAIANGIIGADSYDMTQLEVPAKRHEVAGFFAKILPEGDYAVINQIAEIPDVTEKRAYYNDVMRLYKAGILTGSDSYGTFYPENNITRAEIAAIINRVALPENRVSKTFDKVSNADAHLLVFNFNMNGRNGINSGWLLDNRGAVPRTSATEVYGALYDIDTTAGARYIREFNKTSTGIVTISTTATISGYDGVALEFCDEDSNPIYKLATVDGNWNVLTPDGYKKVYDIDANSLTFSFKIDVDLDNARSVTYINDTNVGTHPLTRSNDINLMSFMFTTDKEHTSVINPGTVTMYVNYPIYGSVSATPDKPYTKTLTPLGGDKVISEFEIMTQRNEKSSYKVLSGSKVIADFTNDENSFYLNGEKIYDNYYTTMYYRIRLELDMNTMEIVAKLNGREVGKVPFGASTASVDTVTFSSNVAKTIIRCKTFRYIEHDDYVPVPVKPKGEEKYNVGINVCSIWRNGYAPQGGWSLISPYDDRQPVIGYYDEGIPETADWEIKYLLEHGVDFQAFCVFFGNRAKAEQLEAYHLYDGFMNAKYSHMTKFAVIWEAAGGEVPANMGIFKDSYVPYMIENFFKDPRYMTIENKPVFIIYGLGSLQSALGGTEMVREGLDYMEEEVKKLGYDGIIYLCCNPSSSPDYVAMGIDGCYAYNWGTGGSSVAINTTYMEKSANVEGGCYTVPLASVGFDSVAWSGEKHSMMTKEDLSTVLNWIKSDYLPKYAKESWQKNFVMLSNWNEYGEGTFMMPTTDQKGFGYLDAIREAYTDEKVDESLNTVPTPSQKERITHMYPQYRRILKKQSLVKEELLMDELVSVGKVGSEAYAYTLQVGGFRIDDDGVMSGGSTGTDPVVMLQHVKQQINIDDVVAFNITLEVPEGSTVQVFYKTRENNTWSGARCVTFTSETSEKQTVTLSTSNLTGWSGEFTGFRIDPCITPGVDFKIWNLELFEYSEKIPSRIVEINSVSNLLTFLPFYSPVNGDLYIPFEPITGIDYQLDLFHLWYKDEGVLKLYGKDHEMIFTVGEDSYLFDGEKRMLDMKLTQIDGIPYIPLNIICDELGYNFLMLGKKASVATHDNTYFVEKEASKVPGRWEFNYAGDSEGWSSSHMSLVVSDGAMKCESLSESTDPIIMSKGGLNLEASKYGTLEVKIRYKFQGERTRHLQIFFVTNKDSGWSETKALNIMLEGTDSKGEWEIYTLDLSTMETWKDTIAQLRFDPFNAYGTMEVDYIRFIEK